MASINIISTPKNCIYYGRLLVALSVCVSCSISVYSNIVAFGDPPSFAWLEKYGTKKDNPFATDVFDPFAQNNQAMQTEGWSVLWCCVTLYSFTN